MPDLITPFTIFPSIDLRGGRVVRLAHGDPERQTDYGNDPAAVARLWQGQGATWLHVVNLDGAFGAASVLNAEALRAVLAVGVKVQFGGGLREEASVRQAFEAGVGRVVMGTAAIERPALMDWALAAYGPERVAVGIDARDGVVRVRGWADETRVSPATLGIRMRQQGVTWCVFTDIGRDGIYGGSNVEATAELARVTGLRVIASGGVTTSAEIRALRAAGLSGVIVGRALHDGRVSLPELLSEAMV
jgi:phosphoribosylformimino-5-aminoimidazole carboxamide ribotide isomerase